MKKTTAFLVLLQVLLLTFGCNDYVKDIAVYTANVPLYIGAEEFRATTRVNVARELKKPGKICLYGNYIFINEIGEGIHVIDNTDPSKPRNVTFIEIMGNVDLAAKDGRLYADNLVDLVVFDITDFQNIQLIKRIPDAFKGALPATNNNNPIAKLEETDNIVVGWEQEIITQEIRKIYPEENMMIDQGAFWSSNSATPGTSITGVNGSMSRFAIGGNYLYTLNYVNRWNNPEASVQTADRVMNYTKLKVFGIEGNAIEEVNSIPVFGTIETIFAYGENLFLGKPDGMDILSIKTPTAPVYLSSSWHFWGCDPVVVNGNYAYLTIRSSNTCGQNGNLLQVIDISDVMKPIVVSRYEMKEPYGLGIDGNRLFVCDDGLKVFDATEPALVGKKLLFSTTEFKGYDLIPWKNQLLVIGSDGLYQYSYGGNHLNQLSVIPVSK